MPEDHTSVDLFHQSTSRRLPTTQQLAPELWDVIARYLRPRDLNCLCSTSSYFLALLRGTLYRTLKLGAGSPNSSLEPMLKLLTYDSNLASCITCFTLWTSKRDLCLPSYFLGLVKSMISLKKLKLVGGGPIFNNAEEQRHFVEHMSARGNPLEDFAIDLGSVLGVGLYDGYLPISNLRHLSFQLYGNENYSGVSPMCSLLEASCETVHSLSIQAVIRHSWEALERSPFAMRFPHLQSISIRRVESFDWLAFPGFLVAHSRTLEELHLAIYGRSLASLASCGQFWKPDLLPSLRYFGGPTSIFRDMTSAKMDCLCSLKSLHLGVYEFYSVSGRRRDNASGLLNQLQEWQATSPQGEEMNSILGLTELQLNLCYYDREGQDITCCPECYWSRKCLLQQEAHKHPVIPSWCSGPLYVQEVFDVLDCFTQICGGTLEVWKGEINFPVDQARLVAELGKFEKLRVVHVSEFAISKDTEDFVLALATKCPLLEEVAVAA